MTDGFRGSDERGSASLEFATVGLVLLVPLVYLVLAVAQLQAGALAVEGAARQAARVYVEATDAASGATAAEKAVRIGLADYGVDPAAAAITVHCTPTPARCLEPGSRVEVVVTARVPLPFVPDVLELAPVASVQLEAAASQTVSRFARVHP